MADCLACQHTNVPEAWSRCRGIQGQTFRPAVAWAMRKGMSSSLEIVRPWMGIPAKPLASAAPSGATPTTVLRANRDIGLPETDGDLARVGKLLERLLVAGTVDLNDDYRSSPSGPTKALPDLRIDDLGKGPSDGQLVEECLRGRKRTTADAIGKRLQKPFTSPYGHRGDLAHHAIMLHPH